MSPPTWLRPNRAPRRLARGPRVSTCSRQKNHLCYFFAAGLGDIAGALEAASQKLGAEVKIGYLATSLGNFLLFEDDLQKLNRVQCLHLMGLTERGLGQLRHAQRSFRETLSLDINHLYARQELRMWLPETRMV